MSMETILNDLERRIRERERMLRETDEAMMPRTAYHPQGFEWPVLFLQEQVYMLHDFYAAKRDIMQRRRELAAAQQAYEAGLGASEWEAFMDRIPRVRE